MTETTEASVLNSQAFILLYERHSIPRLSCLRQAFSDRIVFVKLGVEGTVFIRRILLSNFACVLQWYVLLNPLFIAVVSVI